MAQENQQYSPPSALSKNSANTRPSSSSIASKYHIDFEALGAKSSQALAAVKFNWKEDRIELGSIGLMADRESTVKRLRELCNEEPSIDVRIEMADAASLLKLTNSSTDENIESAGQKAHRGALLLLQAEILRKNGLQLFSESQNSFKDIL